MQIINRIEKNVDNFMENKIKIVVCYGSFFIYL